MTANKALLATHGTEIFDAADQVGAQVYYEAAAAGAIPIIRPLRDSLAGDRVQRIMGIVNGTTNYILDRMDTEGAELADVLADAQRLGYAEADPTADVEGYDAAQKAAILASLAFHTTVPLESVHREGITGIDKSMMDAARHAGYVIKLLAVCERLTADRRLRRMPEPLDSPPQRASRSRCACIPRSSAATTRSPACTARTTRCSCRPRPPATSCSTARARAACRRPPLSSATSSRPRAGTSQVASASASRRAPTSRSSRSAASRRATRSPSRWTTEPGVLATIAGILSEGRVSIATVEQTVSGEDARTASLVIGTHKALEQDLSETVDRLAASGVVERVVSVLRVEGD